MSDFDPNIKQISGPTNIVRLEGDIHGIKKVIYLFMDWHVPIFNQSECTNLFSKDVNKYFVESFYELNKGDKIYDFFVEIRPTEHITDIKWFENEEKYKQIYISQIVKFFIKIFKYDKEKNIVGMPDLFKNIRLHYLDVRDYFMNPLYSNLRKATEFANFSLRNVMLNPQYLDDTIKLLIDTEKGIKIVINILSSAVYEDPKNKPIYIKPKDFETFDEEMIKRLTNKLKERYNYPEIKKILNKFLDIIINEFIDFEKKLNITINTFIEYHKLITIPNIGLTLTRDEKRYDIYSYGISTYMIRDMIKNVADMLERLFDHFIAIFAKLTDVYFLRRFLDKDYITNAIVYSGAAHSQTYINILVNYFDFNITNVSYSKIKDLVQLKKEIKNISLDEMTNLFSPPILYQCSDITNFPKNFL